jgi:hypothetical protein
MNFSSRDSIDLTRRLAHTIFEEYGTIRGKDDGDYLNCTDVDDLADVIYKFLTGPPENQN